MKPKLYLLILAPVLFLAACSKSRLDSPASIAGTWQLEYAERFRSYGTEPVNTGYEFGEFYFSNNGSAKFTDDIGTLNGSWRMVQRSDGYYDHNGNYQSGIRYSLELRMYDNYSNDAIEWEFYAVEFSGNRMIGYMNRFGNEYRYVFRRY
jgi:hypothetical protein